MAESTGIKYMLISAILLTLILVASLTFAINTAHEYGFSDDAVSSPFFNYTEMNSSLFTGKTESEEEWKTGFINQTEITELGEMEYLGIWGNMKKGWNYLVFPLAVFNGILRDVLKVPPVVITTIGFLMVIILVFAFWRTIKTGDD